MVENEGCDGGGGLILADVDDVEGITLIPPMGGVKKGIGGCCCCCGGSLGAPPGPALLKSNKGGCCD